MAKKVTKQPLPGKSTTWGGATVKQQKLPSGAKLVFSDDEEAILVFLGTKDITDKVPGADSPVIYNIFYDGRRVVNCPMSYSLQEVNFEKDKFYYLHLDSEVQTNPNYNPMKDFNIVLLGVENAIVDTPDPVRYGTEKLKLTLENIQEINYSRINYPLRDKAKVKKD